MQTPPVQRGLDAGAFSLQLDCLDLGYEPAAIVGQEYRHNTEDGVNEAAEVQDVVEKSQRGSYRDDGFDG